MWFPLIMCFVSGLPLFVSTNNVTTTQPKNNSTVMIPKLFSLADTKNKTELPMVSEGGTINDKTLILRKENEDIFSTKEIPNSNKEIISSTKARKGVDLNNTEAITSKKSEETPKINTTTLLPLSKDITTHQKVKNYTNTKKVTAKVPTKPMVLTYEDLQEVDSSKNNLNIPAMKSSSKPVVDDQMPPPGKDYKKYSTRSEGHPGLVIPIIITILVVPMFAVVAYMALKRGREAWKNRHYKRMDFLLDGMYNE